VLAKVLDKLEDIQSPPRTSQPRPSLLKRSDSNATLLCEIEDRLKQNILFSLRSNTNHIGRRGMVTHLVEYGIVLRVMM
jgi:hypothetical protein